MTRYRVGIVGLSWITSDPAEAGSAPVLGLSTPQTHAAALARMPQTQVVAGCDIMPEACQRFSDRWASTWPGLRVYDDYREMLAQEELDLVSVATPDDLHTPVVLEALGDGVRAIFCEKPMATNLADADRMIEAIEQAGAMVSVNHTRRWMPSYVVVRELVRTGAIGDLIQITVQFNGPRAMLWRNHSHFLDLICYFAEGEPAWTMAELEDGFKDYGTTYRGDGGRSPELEPGLNAYFAFDNGVRAFLGGMKRGGPEMSVDLTGTGGRIRVNDREASLTVPGDGGLVTRTIHPAGTMGGMEAALTDLLTCLETGQTPQCPPREARKAVAMIEGVLASQAAGNRRVAIG